MSQLYLVVDDLSQWQHEIQGQAVISFDTYLSEHPIKGQKKTRIINLCNTDQYLSKGYYCSLLAEARGHKVLPPVNTLTDLASQQLTLVIASEVLADIKKSDLTRTEEGHSFRVYFGRSALPQLKQLSRRLFERFPCPILEVVLAHNEDGWQVRSVKAVAYAELGETEIPFFLEALSAFTQSQWLRKRSSRAGRWDMAILVNPTEQLPPSDSSAIKRMKRAAEKIGFEVEIIGPQDYARLIGDGLYGIDIKQQGSKVYVIEVNDNPSLEHGVEDQFIGDELYMQIMAEFARRLENRGR